MLYYRRSFLQGALAASPLLGAVSNIKAQSVWPTKTVRFVVPFAPGGTSEIVARTVAAELTKQTGVSVFVENKPGGAGVTAMLDVQRSTPDGHTMILSHVGTMAVNPFMLKNQPYDVGRDFTPVTLLAKVPNVYVCHPDIAANNLKEFIEYTKKRPGQLNYGSAGNASAGHLAFEYLKMVSGLYVIHIPYRGSGPLLTDLVAGRIQACNIGLPAVAPHIKSGKLRAIGVGTAKRLAALPDVPTVQETGYKGFETSQWYGVHVPAGTPPAVVIKMQEELAKALKASSVTERFATDSAVGGGGPASEYAAFIAQEQKLWKQVVDRAGIKPD
jgi:tripartite-type tricarboxylate transporter receptor subunit TctC